MTTTIRLILTIATIAIVGCTGPTRGGVRPAPPGPRDIVHGVLFGDFSRLCPEHFDFCSDGHNSICCPSGGCCEDASGPYCCEAYTDRRPPVDGNRPPDDYHDDRESFTDWDARAGRGPCGPNSTTCSRGGRVLCCSENEGCCSDDRGLLYCCASDRRHGY